MTVFSPDLPDATGPISREVAGAIAAFWTSGAGPSHSSISSALALAGVDEPEASNKEDRVRMALRHAGPDAAVRLTEELVELLRSGGMFDDGGGPRAAKLRSALKRQGAALSGEGYIDWPHDGSDSPAPPAAGPSTRLTPAVASIDEPEDVSAPCIDFMVDMLRRLPHAARSLQLRRHGRDGLSVVDEYDVQDLAESALRLMYADVRPEERGPSSAGSSSQIDLLVKAERCAVEIKVTRAGRAEKHLKPEVLVDIHDYQHHPTVSTLVVLVYDLAGTISNAEGFEQDLSRSEDQLDVRVVVVGWPRPPRR